MIQSSRSLAELETLWQKRLQDCVPVQYLVGRVTWRQFQLQVSPAVLIPRPETELIIDLVLDAIQNQPQIQGGIWVDLGTGSGAIALGLAEALPNSQGYAIDISEGALAIASQNAEAYNLEHRITFQQGSWFAPLATLKRQLNIIVSNPPYIPTRVVAGLQPEVVHHEPHLALDGGADGLDAIRHLSHTAPLYLKPGGLLVMECMADQGQQIQSLLEAKGDYQHITIHHDWANLDRFVLAFVRE